MSSQNNANINNIQQIVRDIVRREQSNAVPNVISQSSEPVSRPHASQGNYSSLQQELYSRYRIPRTDDTVTVHMDQQQQSTHRPTQLQLAGSFDPLQNYASTSRRQSRFVPYRRGRHAAQRGSSTASTSIKTKSAGEFKKDVFLLPCNDWRKLPRGAERTKLHRKGLHRDAVSFNKEWKQTEVIEKLTNVFKDQLIDVRGSPASFTFMKVVCNDIVPVNMEANSEMSGDILKHITGQSQNIYIMACTKLSVWEENDDGDDDKVSLSEVPPTYEEAEPGTSTSAKPCIAASHSGGTVDLRTIFPDKDVGYLNEKLASYNGDVEQTVLSILNEQDMPDTRDIFDLPLCSFKEEPEKVFQRFQETMKEDTPRRQLISICRRSNTIIKDLIKDYKCGRIDVRKIPDIEFIGEEGIDAKGLTREFCHLVMTSLCEGKGGFVFFEGEKDHLLPVHCAEYVSSHYFLYVGKMIAHSVLHTGTGPVGLSRALCTLLITSDMDRAMMDLTVKDVPDVEVRETLEKIQNADTQEVLDSVTASEMLLLTEAGFANEMLSTNNKHRACQCLMTHVVFKTRRDEIDQIREGLESISLMSFLDHTEGCLALVFPETKDVKVSADSFLDLLPKGWLSGLTGLEKRTMEWFAQYVKDVHGGIKGDNEATLSSLPSMAELVQFVVGHPYLSSQQLHIMFTATSTYPDPDACFLSLTLPTSHASYTEFKLVMNTAITSQHVGFGRG